MESNLARQRRIGQALPVRPERFVRTSRGGSLRIRFRPLRSMSVAVAILRELPLVNKISSDQQCSLFNALVRTGSAPLRDHRNRATYLGKTTTMAHVLKYFDSSARQFTKK